MAPGSRMMRLMDRPLSIGSEAASSWVTEPSSLSKAGRMAENDATWSDFAVMICLPPDQMALGPEFIALSLSRFLPAGRSDGLETCFPEPGVNMFPPAPEGDPSRRYLRR